MTYETAPRAYNSTTPKNLLGRTEEFDNAAWAKSNSYVQTNLLLYSEQFDVAASWSLVNINTPTANAGVSPNGTTSADKIVGNGTASGHIISQIGVASAALGTTYTTSVYVKASGYGFAFVGLNGVAYTSAPYISVNLTDGSFFTVNGAPSATSVTDVGNGWYRVSISGVTLAVGSVQLEVRPSPDGVWANRSDAQNGTDGILAWGAQLVQGATAGDYQQTLAAAAAVQYTAPNGYLNADKLVEDTATSEHFVDQPFTAISATTYTYSAYLKAGERSQAVLRFAVGSVFVGGSVQVGFTLTGSGSSFAISGSPTAQSITAVGNGWYRCSISVLTVPAVAATPTARVQLYDGTSTTYTGNGTSGAYLWGAQLSDSASVDPYVYNPAAALTSTAYYGPRFDYDPVTLAPLGLLIEEARTNVILWSEDFTNAAWDVTQLVTVTGNTAASPSGTTTADSLIEAAGTGTHHIHDLVGPLTPAIGTSYTMTGYVKAPASGNIGRYVQLSFWIAGFGATAYMNYDIQAGVVGTGGAGITASSITPVGNGWYRISATAVATATGASGWQLAFVTSTTAARTESYTVTVGNEKTVYIWGAQLETGAFSTSYIPTVAASVTRSADVATMIGNNFTNWYNQTTGTFALSAEASANSNAEYLEVCDTGNTVNSFYFDNSGGSMRNVTFSGSAAVSILNLGAIGTVGVTNKLAGAYALNDFAASRNGGTVVTDTAGAVPVGALQMNIGRSVNAVASTYIDGHIKFISYYNTRLPNAQLQAITA